MSADAVDPEQYDPGHYDPGHYDPGHYDSAYYTANGQSGDRPALRWYVRLVRRYCAPGSGAPGPYLDFGCGTGHLLRRLAAHGPAAGLEVSPWAAAAARRTAPGCPVYEHADDLPGETFGALVAIHVVEHLDDATLADALATWRRILRPGGRALVATPDLAGRGRALRGDGWVGFRDPTHVNLKSHAQWREFFAEHGFDVAQEGSDGLWDVPYGRRPSPLDALRAVPSFAQYLAGRLVLAPGSGESAVLVLERRGTIDGWRP